MLQLERIETSGFEASDAATKEAQRGAEMAQGHLNPARPVTIYTAALADGRPCGRAWTYRPEARPFWAAVFVVSDEPEA